jgi:hypothetical protein
MSVGVMEDYKLRDLRAPRTHWVGRRSAVDTVEFIIMFIMNR